MTRLVFILALLFTAPWQEAETVDVRDRGPVNLKAFNCQDVTRSSIIARVCYDDANQYMLVQRNGIYDHYCELPEAARDALLNAPSMGQYFIANIKGAGRDGNGPHDCRTRKVSSYQ
ncbi:MULTISPECIES: KTSC domain-containing protein [unclassified Bradyrhizobium]|uniref:KTSC domain-containing protein n=1 Tax=unclassified Bradyrhizobium TaxID=2631580 RepID=UPI002FF39DCC